MTVEKSSPDDLLAKAAEWVEQTGFGLEMRVARDISACGFSAIQSSYYIDEQTGEPREIDVVGVLTEPGKHAVHLSYLPIECKYSKVPWIMLTTDHAPAAPPENERVAPLDVMATPARGDFTRHLLMARGGLGTLLGCRSAPRIGYAMRPMTRQKRSPEQDRTEATEKSETNKKDRERDDAYSAMHTVSKAAWFLCKDTMPRTQFSTIAFPVIVLDGILLEAYLRDNAIVIERSERLVMHWRWPGQSGGGTLIHVVTRDQLPAFATQARQDISALLTDFVKYEELARAAVTAEPTYPVPPWGPDSLQASPLT